MGNLTPTVRGLLIINVFVFIANSFIGNGSLGELGVLWYIEFPEFKPWQLMTHMFLHADFFHLLGNMMGLFFFGPWLERAWGARNLFIFYFACGFGGAALQMVSFANDYPAKNAKVIAIESKIKEHKAAVAEFKRNPTPEGYAKYLKENDPESYKQESKFLTAALAVLERAKVLAKMDTTNASDSLKTAILKNNTLKAHYLKESKKAVVSVEKSINKVYAQADEYVDVMRREGFGLKMLGASGAIFGILVAFALFFPNVEMMMLFIPFPIKAKYFVAIYMIFTIYAASGGKVGMDNVAHLAHLGGAIIGLILARFWLWKYKY